MSTVLPSVPPIKSATVPEAIAEGATVSGKIPRMMWLLLGSLKAVGPVATRREVVAHLLSRDSQARDAERDYFADNATSLQGLVSRGRIDLIAYNFMAAAGRKWELTTRGWITSTEAELHFVTKDEAVDETTKSTWQADIITHMHAMTPAAFEAFVGTLLSKAGVFDVAIDGRTGDGGIDGHGSMVNGPLSIPVFFQAKRWSGSVSSATVRDFRGAIQGRGHVGMVFTTGTFTKDAKAEAQRTQSVNIQLFDGVRMADWLKDLHMGVTVRERTVEDVEVDDDWWDSLANGASK